MEEVFVTVTRARFTRFISEHTRTNTPILKPTNETNKHVQANKNRPGPNIFEQTGYDRGGDPDRRARTLHAAHGPYPENS